MSELQQAVDRFLACHRIAVAGVSRRSGEAANAIYRKLRDAGYEVFAVNPKADEVEGDRCYPELGSIPGGVEAVVVATPPKAAPEVVRQGVEAGVRHVWMHRSFGPGSVSEEATALCRQHGIAVIPGACPMMYCQPVDVAHRCIRWVLKLSGGLPQAQAPPPA